MKKVNAIFTDRNTRNSGVLFQKVNLLRTPHFPSLKLVTSLKMHVWHVRFILREVRALTALGDEQLSTLSYFSQNFAFVVLSKSLLNQGLLLS